MTAAPLTIGIDARELLGEPTGVGRYLGELLRRWVRRPDSASDAVHVGAGGTKPK